MGLFAYRLMGAAVLDASMYEGIEADRHVTWQAGLTVILASLAAGVGASQHSNNRVGMFAGVTALALVTWTAWAMLTLQIGSRTLPDPATRATFGQLLRTTGFAAAPGLLQVFAIFPRMALPIFAGTGIWMLVAMVFAVKHALDYQSMTRALAVCATAAAMAIAMAVFIAILFGSVVS